MLSRAFSSGAAFVAMSAEAKVFLVDDDAAVRDSLVVLLRSAGHAAETFSGAEDFLRCCPPSIRGCIILDVKMPGMDGPTLQGELTRRGFRLPVIFLSGHGTIPITVQAIKAGALNFLTKPIDGAVLLANVQEALNLDMLTQKKAQTQQSFCSRLAALTEREREIMGLAVGGYTNKEIAQRLAISHRTVEIHRARILQKTGASNLLELARMSGLIDSLQTPR